MAFVGVMLLPWVEASFVAGGTARGSFLDVMRALRNARSELTGLEKVALTVPALPAIAGIAALWTAFSAFDHPNDLPPPTAAGLIVVVGVWFGWVIYVVNRELNNVAFVLMAAGFDARIGPGAWVTLLGIAAIAGGVLYGSST